MEKIVADAILETLTEIADSINEGGYSSAISQIDNLKMYIWREPRIENERELAVGQERKKIGEELQIVKNGLAAGWSVSSMQTLDKLIARLLKGEPTSNDESGEKHNNARTGC